MAEQLSRNDKAAARMRRQRATILGRAKDLARGRAHRRLQHLHQAEFEAIYREEVMLAQAELYAKAQRQR